MVLVRQQVRSTRSRPAANRGHRPEKRLAVSHQASSVRSEHPGLCSTCDYAPTCGNRGTDARPVHSCEEFYAFTPATVVEPPAAQRPAKEDSVPLRGLCGNCESRQTCTMHRPESGIWHCEEYQ